MQRDNLNLITRVELIEAPGSAGIVIGLNKLLKQPGIEFLTILNYCWNGGEWHQKPYKCSIGFRESDSTETGLVAVSLDEKSIFSLTYTINEFLKQHPNSVRDITYLSRVINPKNSVAPETTFHSALIVYSP